MFVRQTRWYFRFLCLGFLKHRSSKPRSYLARKKIRFSFIKCMIILDLEKGISQFWLAKVFKVALSVSKARVVNCKGSDMLESTTIEIIPDYNHVFAVEAKFREEIFFLSYHLKILRIVTGYRIVSIPRSDATLASGQENNFGLFPCFRNNLTMKVK